MGLQERWMKKQTEAILIATLLSTLGVFFSYPEKGMVATLPVAFLFFALSLCVYPRPFLTLLLSAGVSLVYGVMGRFELVFFWVLSSFFIALFTFLGMKGLRALLAKKKGGSLLLLFFLF